jgi:hypothetical protein
VNRLVRQPSAHESHLRRLIRKMIKEELKALFEGEQTTEEKEPAAAGISDVKQPEQNIAPPRFADGFQTDTWAIFGSPEPDPEKRLISQREQPRALPGFPELYRPDFTGFDSPPFITQRPQPFQDK